MESLPVQADLTRWPNGGDPLPVQAVTDHNKPHTLWDYLSYFELTKINWCCMTKTFIRHFILKDQLLPPSI